jgi:hypothetical protein
MVYKGHPKPTERRVDSVSRPVWLICKTIDVGASGLPGMVFQHASEIP